MGWPCSFAGQNDAAMIGFISLSLTHRYYISLNVYTWTTLSLFLGPECLRPQNADRWPKLNQPILVFSRIQYLEEDDFLSLPKMGVTMATQQ